MIRKTFLFSLTAMVLVTGCSNKATRQIASGSFDYVESRRSVPIKIPEGLDTPPTTKDFEIPSIGDGARADLIGSNVKVVSPALVIPIVTGSHIEEGKQSASVKFDKINDNESLETTIWNTLIGYLEEENIAVDNFDRDAGTLSTSWILEKQEEDSAWYEFYGSSSEIGRRFEFALNVAPHGRTATLDVNLKDYLKTVEDDLVADIDSISPRREEVEILNRVITHYEYQIGLENNRRIEIIRQGLNVKMGFNPDGEPAFVIDGIYDITWPRLQLVLRSLNFDVKDLDKTNGLLFVTYNGNGGSWWNNIFTSDEELVAIGDYRLRVNDLGQKTAVTFMDDQNQPFEPNVVSDLFAAFSAAMAKDDLDI